MANVQQKSANSRTFAKSFYNYDPSTTTTISTENNTNPTHTLKLKPNANSLRFPFSSITRAVTPDSTRFRVSVQEFRNKLNKRGNKRPLLKQSKTDNYYNTTNASLTHHAFRKPVYTDINGQITESEDESESLTFTKAYSQYQKTDISQFPDTCTQNINIQNKIHTMQHKMSKLQHELAIKTKEIDHLAFIANNNLYSDGDITDEGMTTDDDDSTRDQKCWINKKKYTNRHSKVTNMKMSQLFKETADKFLVFLKQDELKKELAQEKYTLKFYEKVQENKQLMAENVKLTQKNNVLNDKILQLKCELNTAEKKIKQFANVTVTNQKRSVSNKLSIDISGVFRAIDNNTSRELSGDEVELYELLRTFIDLHENQNDFKYSPTRSPMCIENECEIISFDNFDTPISINNDLSIQSNESTPSLMMDVVSNSALDPFEPYEVIPNDNVNVKFNVNQSKSESYWKRKNKINPTASRHRTNIVSKTPNCTSIKPKFDFFDPPNAKYDVGNLSFAALSNLPDHPEELIRTLSNQTNVSITSTHRMRTEKAKHKHKRKHKNAKISNSVYPSDDNKESQSPKKCENEKIKAPVFADITSWREIMDKQNNERVENSTKLTPMNSEEFFGNGNGVIKIPQFSLTKITALLHK